jgi:hypothetical protein
MPRSMSSARALTSSPKRIANMARATPTRVDASAHSITCLRASADVSGSSGGAE